MKFVILHGTGATSSDNWFPWLSKQLTELGHDVWVPDLPNADSPDARTYNRYLIDSGYDFTDAVVIGHSAGAVEINALLQEIDVNVKTAVLVGVFRGDLGWESLRGMDIRFDYTAIKQRAQNFYVIHSDDDPLCPLEDAQWIANELNATFILMRNKKHFSLSMDPAFDMFPELLDLINQKIVVS